MGWTAAASRLGFQLAEAGELGVGAAGLFGLPSSTDLGRTLGLEASVPWVVVSPLIENFDSVANWADLFEGLGSFMNSKLADTRLIWIVDETAVSSDQRQILYQMHTNRDVPEDAWHQSGSMTREFIRRTLDGEDVELAGIVLLAPRRNADLLNFLENASVSLVLVNGDAYVAHDKRIVASFHVDIQQTLEKGRNLLLEGASAAELEPVVSFAVHLSPEN